MLGLLMLCRVLLHLSLHLLLLLLLRLSLWLSLLQPSFVLPLPTHPPPITTADTHHLRLRYRRPRHHYHYQDLDTDTHDHEHVYKHERHEHGHRQLSTSTTPTTGTTDAAVVNAIASYPCTTLHSKTYTHTPLPSHGIHHTISSLAQRHLLRTPLATRSGGQHYIELAAVPSGAWGRGLIGQHEEIGTREQRHGPCERREI